MRTLSHIVDGDACEINILEYREDVVAFEAWLQESAGMVISFDTETTGLDIYSPTFGLRLAQFGLPTKAFVLPAEQFRQTIIATLRDTSRHYVIHNASYDLQVLDRCLGVKIESMANRTFDTRIMAHLVDPRERSEGGIGLGLKPLSEVYIDPTAPDTQAGLTEVFRSAGLTKATGFAKIDIKNETYLRYAGLDVILGSRLFHKLYDIIVEMGLTTLCAFEHELSVCLMKMQRKGMLLDVGYTETLSSKLEAEAAQYSKIAAQWGVNNVNSTTQVAAALTVMGEELTEKTDSGNPKVDKGVLLPMADLGMQWDRLNVRTPNPLADAVLRSKRAEKWKTSYVEAFLHGRDTDNRIHATLGALQARTARMSVSNPPLQQLPSGDWTIRRALLADPGMTIVASDYKQVEMRVLAALCGDENLLRAVRSGEDLHDFTARLIKGDGFTKKDRKLFKGVGFGKVYGGGATTLARQTGAPYADVVNAIKAYDKTFPGIKRYAKRLQNAAQYGKMEVVTPSGRVLPLDRDRVYAATNYVVQSTARDLLAQAITTIFDAGLGDYLLMPVHDELICQAPTGQAEEVVREIGRLMDYEDFLGVPIASDPEVYGPSWGHGYGAPA